MAQNEVGPFFFSVFLSSWEPWLLVVLLNYFWIILIPDLEAESDRRLVALMGQGVLGALIKPPRARRNNGMELLMSKSHVHLDIFSVNDFLTLSGGQIP